MTDELEERIEVLETTVLELDEDIDNINADINILQADVSDIGNDIEGASSILILRLIYSGESKGGGRQGSDPHLGPNFFIFMQFLAKYLQNYRLAHRPWEVTYLSGKSCIRHWFRVSKSQLFS